ncbi:MAG TPA: tRNA-uridine aminocarboxypropyltransferase [Aliidongia sp.]|uniref:tRNA-uridine aminocarboxypropyltransferase n=1 Tax=Aliidongia sp. TaxID=1914230 RepID=UPI002DDD19B4|nr:tRNA-uridine aminocarboxypropyltransferase [Aliidongia sp.]HEV2675965.1 tRNA-uridine aminocarboxypropyltransferase [Aliidongia sp.]
MDLETPPAEICPRCLKAAPLCVCADIEAIANRVSVLILQHPQEQDRDLGTARLAARHFQNVTFKVGLSWPNLAKALGRPVADPKRWGVLYLGPATLPPEARERELVVLDRKGGLDLAQDDVLASLDGVVLLDGTWSQAKALWWRNAWLLKLRRIVLEPKAPSRYGKLRKEPRRESISTLEATAILMSRLERRPDLQTRMIASFDALLQRYRDSRRKPPIEI